MIDFPYTVSLPENISLSDAISFVALSIAGYSAWSSRRFNKHQESINKIQKDLNARLLEKEDEEARKNRKADLSAAFYKFGKSSYRIKIWNQGKTIAKNIRIDFPEGNEIVTQTEIQDIFPLDILEPQHSVELNAFVHMQTKSKHCLKLTWDDSLSLNNEKICRLVL